MDAGRRRDVAPGAITPGTAGALRSALAARSFAYSRMVGDSMLPTMRDGDVAIVEPVETLTLGDVVVFELYGELVAHRIIRLGDDEVGCRGDNRVVGDPPVLRSEVLGRVSEIVGRGVPGPRARLGVARRLTFALRLARWWRLRVTAEARLAAAQRRASPRRHRRATTESGEASAGAASAAVSPAAMTVASLAQGPYLVASSSRIDLPFGLYGGLDAAERGELLDRLPVGELTALCADIAAGGRFVRWTGAFRRVAARLGLTVGRPGDAALPLDAAGRWRFVHFFTRREMTEEFERHGWEVELEPLVVDLAPAWRAVAGRRDGGPDAVTASNTAGGTAPFRH